MQINNIPASDIRRIIAGINREYRTSIASDNVIEWRGGRRKDKVRVRLVLRLEDSGDTFHRRTMQQGRRTRGVCWHAHMLLIRRVFMVNPNAKVKTSYMRYSDVDDFVKKYTEVGQKQLGGQGQWYSELCDCHKDVELTARLEGELYGVGVGSGAEAIEELGQR